MCGLAGRFSGTLLAVTFLLIALASGWVNAEQAPGTPSSVSVTRGDGTLTASWPEVSGATSYHVTYSSDGGGSWSLAALNHPRTSITIGVDNAKTYLVGVRARNKHGDSGWRNSASSGPYRPPAPPPDTPSSVSVTRGDGTLTASWPEVSGATSYHVTYSSDGGGSWSLAALNHPRTSITIGVDNGKTYLVGVRARNGQGDSGWRNSASSGPYTQEPAESLSVTLSVNPSTISEDTGATSVTVTATASSSVTENTAVTVSIGGGSATAGTDYTTSVTELTLEIPVGGTTGTGAFKLTPVDDTEVEGKETIKVSGSASGLTVNGTSLTLKDKEEVTAQWWYGAKLSLSPGSVSENGGKQQVTVTADVSEWGTSSSDQSYEVTVGKGGDSAVSGTDYHAISKFKITVKANRRSGSNSFNLEPIGDTDWEGDETITIHASGPDGAQSVTLTLTDEGDRPYSGPQVTLTANPSKLSEADSAKTVTVTAASSAHSAARTVTVSVGASGTATSGTDYAAVSDFTISLAKNATSATGTFTLTPTQDTLAEGDETIAIAGNVEGVAGKLTGTTLTLTDDEAALDIRLSASPASVNENGGAKTVTVTATAAAAAAKARTVLVAVGNRQDTATAGTDYTVVPAFNITIAANATTATGTFSLTPTNDTSVEDAESISIDGQPESSGAAFTVGGTSITLTDNDAQPAVTLTATPSSVAEAALATSVTVKATAASAVAWARTVTVSVGKTGSAASGTDYAAVSNFDITIAANALSGTGTFTLKPIQDTTNEGNETIGVAGTSLNTTVTGATVTLADDDINPAVTLSVSPASVLESASATTVTVTATAASASSSARTVAVKVGGGTATSGTDYAAVSDFNITIAASATSGTGTFTLTPTQDTTVEGGETIGVSGSSTGTTVTGTTVALTDDDALPAVTLSVSTSSVAESASATSVTVTATAASSIASARTVTVSVGQTGTASPGSDYAAVTDFDITIAANGTSGTGNFTLTPTQDTVVEYNETIGVDGSSPRTVMTNATITLTDDDKDSVTLSLNRRQLGEEASGTSVTVTATAATAIAAARTVTVSVGDTGTATSGTDYSAVSDFTISIAANATSGTGSFTLTPTQDTTNEGNETIGIAGTNSLSTVTGTTLTLVDDDQDTISLTSDKVGISETWSGSVSITATRPSATASAVAVTVIVGADTDSATEGVDYQKVNDFTITIPANQTSASGNFTLTAIRDAVSDNNEHLSISGLATGYKVSNVANGISIFEWYSTIELKADVSSVSEHDGATTVTVTAHIHPTVYGTTPVDVSVGGGTATSGTDYAAVSNFRINIPNKAGSATGTFTLTPTQDSLLESDETININGHGHHFTTYGGRGTSMTLTDAQPISLSATPSSISEGAAATQVAVTATATGTMATPRTLTVSVGDTGTATSGTDYAAVSDFDITIPANKTGATNTFTLTPTKDSAAEGDETIGVAGSSTGAYVYPTTLTLADTDPAVTLSAAPSSISEAAGATSVTVTATAAEAVGSARTVTVTVGDSGTATSGTDYAAVSDFTITIAANATSGTGSFTLTPTDDTALEGDETIHVTGTSAEAATISRTTLTLTDDDLPTIALATVPANVKIAEGAGLKSVTVRATAAAAMKAETTVTLAIGSGGDSATKTTDYTTSNVRTITIPAGQSTAEASFELTPVQDTSVEGDEFVSVSGTSSGGHRVTGTFLTLTDDDKHAITLSASPSSVAESASGTSVTVTATAKAATSSARTVTVSVGDSGTATSGTDYTAVSDFTVTIAANATSGTGTFTLTPTQDTTVEGNETIGVAGTSTNSTVTGTTVTLTDDDSYPAITLSANPSSVGEGASATSVTVTAAAASAIASARTVTVSVGGTGTASSGTDYSTVADFTVTFAANATSGTGTFTLTPTQDTAVEGSETINVAGSSASSTVTGTTVTLTDDDTHAIALSASPSSVSESKASETVTVTATLNVARSSATAVTVSVGKSTDEATSGTDYEAVSDFTITIAANKTSGTGTFTFKPKTDTAYEGFEDVTISGTTGGSGGGANAQSASIPVTNTSLSIHDSSNYPAVSLSVAPSSVGEDDGATSVTVTATAASAIGSSREVTISVGDSGTATSGTDYTAVSDFIVKIAANTTSGTGTFTLTPTDDSTVEGSETIGVAGSSLSTTVTGTTLTLTDDDSATVTVNNASATEGNDMTFTVTLDTAVAGGLTVTPSFTDVTATEGTDYDENTTALSFSGSANETQTFTVSATEDDVVEGNETFTVGLTVSGTTLAGSITSTDTGTGTIESGTGGDQDTATLIINDASADEGESMTFTVTLSEAVQGGLTVTPSYTNGTAASGDYTSNTTALSFTGTKGETETFTVSTSEDEVLEANETFTLSLTVSGTTLTGSITSTDTGTGTINNDDNASVTINDASTSEGHSMTFTVTLSEAVQGGLTVTPGFTDVTATEGTDYDENTTGLSFSGTKGETETFTISTDEDAVLEANETFTVGLSVSGTALSLTATDTGTGTINNDDSAAVKVNDASADEGDDMTFTVTLSEAVQGGLKVTPSYTNGTAASDDYTANTTALTFTGTKGETKTFTVSTDEDAVLEANETFTVGLSVSGTTLSLTATDTGTGTINNDDGATLTVNDANADEGGSMTFTVTLGAAVQGGLTVTPGYTNGTAASSDYSRNTNILSFTGTANETKTFSVSTSEDAVLEADETFTVGLTVSATSLDVTATDTGTGTINNDDSAAVTVNDANADEGNSMTFTVTLSAAVQGGLTVTPGFTDGTADEGTDYDENTTALSFTGTANETKTFSVSTTEDAVVEDNETFTVGLTVSATSLSVTASDTGTGTINNDDGAVLTVNNANASEGDDMTFTVTLGAAVQGGLTVTPSFTDVTAVEGTDYDENTTALSFTGTANETKTFSVSTTEDAVLEAGETFTVGLSSSNSGVTSTDTGSGTINNDDSAAVTVNDASADEGDGMTFTVTLSAAVQGGLKVTPGYTDGTASSNDYSRNTTPLTFTGTANETKTFTVSTSEDAVLEANETFTVGLSVSGTSLSLTATDTGTGTINNDDSAAVTVNDVNADEGDDMTFTVTLSAAVQGGLKVTPGYTNGTAASNDYTANTTALSFGGTKGEAKSFRVSTIEDAVLEADETFTVGLTVSATSLSVTASDTGTGTINNNDSAAVTVNDANADEGNSMTFTVSLSAAVQGGLKVTPGFTDVTAVEGTDYDENTTVLSFTGTANETKTITISTTEDAVVEANETFRVGLTVSGTSLSVTASDTGTGTINNDDGATVTVNNASAEEGDSMTFTVTLGKAVQGGLTVTPGYTNNTASSGDYTRNTTALNFTGTANETKTFTVSTNEDAIVEADETFRVGLTVSGTTLGVVASDTGIGTIKNDDGAAVTVNDASTVEGESMAFRLTLSAAVQGGLTVAATYRDVSATKGVDYEENTASLSFSGIKGETRTITVSTIEDDVVEGDETFTLGLSTSNSGVSSSDTGTGTIIDDDGAKVTVNDASALEGDSMTFTVTLSEAVQGGLTLTPTYSDVSTVKGVDYEENTASLSFSGTKGETRTITVSTIEDDVVEGDETFTLGLSTSNSGVSSSDTGTGTIKNDDGAVVTVDDASALEGDSMTFTVTLSEAVQGGLTVTPTYSDVSAVKGVDYEENTASLSFNGTKGETKTLSVSTIEDGVVEGNETFTLGLSTSNSGVSSSDTGTGAIHNNDGAPNVNLSLNRLSVGEGEGATQVTVTAAFSNSSTYDTDTDITIWVGSSGTATSGVDYASVSEFTVTIAANEASATAAFTLTPTDDRLVEGDETIGVSGSTAALSVNGTELAVTDDDVAPSVSLSLSPSSAAEDAGVTPIVVTAAFSGAGTYATDKVVTVRVGGSGTAVSGTDYASVSEFTVTIAANAASGTATFTLAPVDDSLAEDSEMIGVSGGAVDLIVNGADLTLTDDDARAVIVSVESLAVEEDGGTATYTVVLGSQPTGDVRVMPSSSDASTVTVSDALTFKASNWSTPQTVTATGVNDDIDNDPDRMTRISHSVSGGGYGEESVSDVAVSSIDDDARAVIVSVESLSVEEDGGTATYTVVLGSQPTGEVRVTPSSSDESTAAVSGALTFKASNWSTPQMVTVTGVNDDVDNDPDREALVTHAASGGGYGGVPAAELMVTSVDDDQIAVLISAQNLLVDEDGGTATYRVVLGSEPVSPVTVTPASGDQSVASVSRALTFTALDWSTPQTVTVTGINDDVDNDPDRQVAISHAVSGGGYEGVAAADVSVTASDDDARAVIVSAERVSVDEDGGTTTYTVVLGSQPTGSVTVTPLSGDESVASVSGALRFTASDWSTPQAVTVTGVDDDIDNETDRETRISHAVSGGGYAGVPVAKVAVTALNDDSIRAVKVRNAMLLAETLRAMSGSTSQVIEGRIQRRLGSEKSVFAQVSGPPKPPKPSSEESSDDAPAPSSSGSSADASTPSPVGASGDWPSGSPAGASAGSTPAGSAGFAIQFAGLLASAFATPGCEPPQLAASALGEVSAHSPDCLRTDSGMDNRRFWPTGGSIEQAFSGLVFWATADRRTLNGRQESMVNWDGAVNGLHAGFDQTIGENMLWGLAISRHSASVDYDAWALGRHASGRQSTQAISAHPYLALNLASGGRLWASAGWGSGEWTDREDGGARYGADISWGNAVAGGALPIIVRGTELEAVFDASLARLALEDGELGLDESSLGVSRVRGALQGQREFVFGSGSRVDLGARLGLRYDGGDGATGMGVETGLGAAWNMPSAGLRLGLEWSLLVAHQGDVDRQSLAAYIEREPTGPGGQGLRFRLAPSLGADATQAGALFEDERLRGLWGIHQITGGPHLDAEIGYGFERFSFSPFAAISTSEDNRRSLKTGLSWATSSGRISWALELERIERPGGPENRVQLRFQSSPRLAPFSQQTQIAK